jgi:CheY-like chemotaxis protein
MVFLHALAQNKNPSGCVSGNNGSFRQGFVLNIPFEHPFPGTTGMSMIGTSTDPFPDTRIYPLQDPCAPLGFHAHRLPSLDSERHIVYRNWIRTLRPSPRRHILVIDDDPTFLGIIGQLLDVEGYDATLSYQLPYEEDIKRLRPDLILAETSFNRGPDGLCLFDESAFATSTDGIPTIYCTVVPDVARRMTSTGRTTLLKPFDLDELLECIAGSLH